MDAVDSSVTMTTPSRGLYDLLISELLKQELASLDGAHDAHSEPLRSAEAADRLALHLARVIERAVDLLPESRRLGDGTALVRRLIAELGRTAETARLVGEQPIAPARVLHAIRARHPNGEPVAISEPLIPLLDTTLLTNAPGEPSVGHQVNAEIGSADRIDLVMAFIRRSGIRPLRDALRAHASAGRPLRVLSTVYTGSTEADALDLLESLGADVRVSYDTTSTRLHAKAWLFHRRSGFSTAYVGSSNLTHSAQVDGLEWNVRLSEARNRPVLQKMSAVFESYWAQDEFEPYDRTRFLDAIGRERPRPMLRLSPTELRLEPFQERLLEQLELARDAGRHRNLLVSATGTGKTVMAAVDYARLRARLPRARLLFVAHREEILEQSLGTFQHALRDPSFGELWVGGAIPKDFNHVFASIQSLGASGFPHLAHDHFDVVVVDEFHHAAATSYTRLLEHLAPRELLGLTATPERSDGLSVLGWFDGRIAAELRLWDAIDQQRLVPFAYYGIADSLDLRDIPWRRGRGYDVDALSGLITSTDVWARQVLQQAEEHLGDLTRARVLGFCVSVEHARYMARVFTEAGVSARAVWSDTRDDERRAALDDLRTGRLHVLFSVDLFNEGVDVPHVDALLMLRPTDSPVLFLQQLGRGLRRAPGKSVCTVLDFVGQHRREFRFDRRLGALLGTTRRALQRQIEQGFPFLPAGCSMQLDRVSRERVLASIRSSVPTHWHEKVDELRRLAQSGADVTLSSYLEETGLELADVYATDRCWSTVRAAAGLPVQASGPQEAVLQRALGRLLHVDDRERLDAWRAWLRSPSIDALERDSRTTRLVRQLLGQVLAALAKQSMRFAEGARLLLAHPQVCAELLELCDVLSERLTHVTRPLASLPAVPLRVHARYTRSEIFAACGLGETIAALHHWREGVYFANAVPADLLAFTLDKTDGQFSPTTRYRDYAISRTLIHWESQSRTRADSPTGRRYREHTARRSHIWLFARLNTSERAFTFLGPAQYVSHDGELPMGITWRLEHALPGDLFQAFAAAVA
jgi:superfamily II DNA or RNA helicase/HKD family nuclease